MAPMAQFPDLVARLSDQGTQSQRTTSHSSAAAIAMNSINQYMTDIHSTSQVQSESQGTAAEFWQQYIIILIITSVEYCYCFAVLITFLLE